MAWHLHHHHHHHHVRVSPATISRYLTCHGLIAPHPVERPRSSCIRFEADLPNECRKADFTHHRLTAGADVEILSRLDDHSRYRTHARTRVLLLDPAGTTNPPAKHPAHNANDPEPLQVRGHSHVLRHHKAVAVGFEPTEGCPSRAFEARSFGRSDTLPPRRIPNVR